MLRRKGCVIGNFGYKKRQLDGQTVKTRVFYSSISNFHKCNFIDIGDGVTLKNVFFLLFLPFFCNKVYFLPGKRILRVYSPFLVLFKCLFLIDIHYIVIGGWITDLARKNRLLCFILKYFNSVSCELKSMVKDLRHLGIKSFYLANFRNCTEDLDVAQNDILRLYFLSRVIPEKGVFTAIELLHEIKRLAPDIVCQLDIYGPNLLNGNDLQLFNSFCIDDVSYKNEISPEFILSTINQYDFLVFPTIYHGEGFPGCIVDAKMACTSVICTDWKYNSEIIIEGVDGFVVGVNDFVRQAAFKIIDAYRENKILELKKMSYESSKEFLADHALPTWLKEINE
ncbi:glycosyltransferase [Marinomonas sp. TW1]|uniref:glycosyltransferase n=1 Tax=Marinomonas sp. TW1 TaxID=1561203 RepID=UPI0007AF7C4B|nr:glycosyltransferase [Marinomonas sp. TW1]KZN15064.1 hypothetical protein OA79_02360 [Marinomonas sp. TW1]